MAEIDELVAEYLDCKSQAETAKQNLEEVAERLMHATVGVGGAHETPDGVKVKYTPASVNERFDAKRYLKDHPDAREGYMVKSRRKETLRVTVPKREELDEFGW